MKYLLSSSIEAIKLALLSTGIALAPALHAGAKVRSATTIPSVVIARGEERLATTYPGLVSRYVRIYVMEVVQGRKIVTGAIHLPGVGIGYPDGVRRNQPLDTRGFKPGYYFVKHKSQLPAGGVCYMGPCDFGIDYVAFDYDTGEVVSR